VIEITRRPGWTEGLIQAGLANYLDWRQNLVFPNVDCWGWESDILVVTKSMKVWEVEIKTNMSDWKSDSKKEKWNKPNWARISRFYYAVPWDLLSASLGHEPIPEFVPPWAGIIVLEWKGGKIWAKESRKPKTLGNYSIKHTRLTKLYRSAYFRYWSTRKRSPDQFGTIDCQDDDLLQLIALPE